MNTFAPTKSARAVRVGLNLERPKSAQACYNNDDNSVCI